MATPLTDAITALTAYANGITGKSDTNLPDAVRSLADGYGPSASVYSGSFTPSEDTLGPSFDIGGSDFSHFFVFASTDVDRVQSRKAFVVCYTEFGEKDVFSITTNNSGALTTPRYLTDKWFVKDGQTVICTNRGASNGGNTGYWLGGVTYNWFAW